MKLDKQVRLKPKTHKATLAKGRALAEALDKNMSINDTVDYCVTNCPFPKRENK